MEKIGGKLYLTHLRRRFLVSRTRAQHKEKHCSGPFSSYLLSPPHQTREGSAGAPSSGSASSPFLSPRASGSNFYFFTAICFTSLFFFPIPSFLFLNYPQPEGLAICRCKNLREIWIKDNSQQEKN